MMTGTTIAQAIPIAISPILTRIYTPEDFGILALYMSIASIFSVVATGQYELAILLPKKDEDAVNIVALSILLTFFVSMILFVIILLFNDQMVKFLGNKEISNWLYLTPVTVFLTGIYNSLNYWLNRKKNYQELSNTKIYQSLTTSASNIIFGVLKYSSGGLILGSILGQFIGTLSLIKKTGVKKLWVDVKKNDLFALAKKYSNFPKITVTHSIFSSLSTSLPVFILAYFFSSKETGYYSFASKIVMMPISLISNAYYQVFFESFSKEEDKESFFKQKFKQVNMIFLPVFFILWFIFPDIFAFVFGETWEIAGVYTQVLLPLFYLKFLSNLFTTTTYIYYEKQFENFMLGVLITSMILISLLIGVYYQNIILGLILMSITNGSIIIYKIYRSFVLIGNKHAK